jgi:hypothetical protein
MLLRLSLLLAATVATANAASFTVPGCTATAPAAINDLNEVVGTATCNGLATAFIRDAAAHFTTYTIDGKPTTAAGVNIHGAIVGSYTIPDCVPNPNLPLVQCEFGYLRSPNGTITTLVTLPVFFILRPIAINASGQIAGNFLDLSGFPRVFLRNDDGTFIIVLPTSKASMTGLSDTGEIVGTQLPFLTFQAFLRAADGTVNLVGPPGQNTFGAGISRLGNHIIGYVETGGENPVGFITTTGLPNLFPLPFTPPPGPVLLGGVNSRGEGVLVNAYLAPNGTVTTITIPDCTAVMAQAINDLGAC